MAEGRQGVLSIGVFLVILAVSILLYVANFISWMLVVPMVLLLSGCWVIVLAGMRASNPQKYERGPFSTFAWGLFLIALGGAWLLYTFNPLYSLALILLVLGALAIATALRKR
ncbi:MAG: hypothetical protein ACUVUE_05565 [Candidatus Bathycorpusculaceae bacterium]